MANLKENREHCNNSATFSKEDFFERWDVEEANELLWQMLIETLQSPSAAAYEAGKLTMLVHDLQKLLAFCNQQAPDLVAQYYAQFTGPEYDLPPHIADLKRKADEANEHASQVENKYNGSLRVA